MNDYITDRELKAHLDPMKADIAETKGDVKTVLAWVNKQKGANSSSRILSDRRLAWAAISAAVASPALVHFI